MRIPVLRSPARIGKLVCPQGAPCGPCSLAALAVVLNATLNCELGRGVLTELQKLLKTYIASSQGRGVVVNRAPRVFIAAYRLDPRMI